MSKRLVSIFVLLAVYVMTPLVGSTQDTATLYIVNGDQPVNARACPRLDCAVIATIAPGTQLSVIETVSGDEVFGSSQWRRATYNGQNIYVHSALLTLQAGADAAPSQTISTTGWREYNFYGARFMAPSGWTDQTDGRQIDLVDPISLTSMRLNVDYDGMSRTVVSVQDFWEGQVTCDCTDILSSQIVSVPAGDAIRIQYKYWNDPDKPSQMYDDEDVFFYLRYSIWFSARQVIFEENLPIFESIVNSFDIRSPAAARLGALRPAGIARRGENSGSLTAGDFDRWVYQGREGETLSIGVQARGRAGDVVDTYLIVRAPDGRVIAEADDSGFLNLSVNPYIGRLELSETGRYEIEVHAWDYGEGSYTLVIGDSEGLLTPEPSDGPRAMADLS